MQAKKERRFESRTVWKRGEGVESGRIKEIERPRWRTGRRPGGQAEMGEDLSRLKTRQIQAAGVVTVVVWPGEDPHHPNARNAASFRYFADG